MIDTKKLDKEIQKYYKLSVFVNKYISIILAFILSVVFMTSSSISGDNDKILAYNSSDILLKQKMKEVPILDKLKKFNKRSKYIKSSLFLTKSNITKDTTNLGYGIFFKDNIYLPSNVIVDNKKFEELSDSEDFAKNYLPFLSTLKQNNTKIIVKKTKLMKDDEVIKKYNLGCMDTVLGETSFCTYNKYALLSDLTNKRFDISKDLYKKILASITESDDNKCLILTKIYFSKYNYNKIKDILDKYCYEDILDKISYAEGILSFSQDNLFSLNENQSSSRVYLTHLVNQIYYLSLKKTISSDDIIPHIKLVNLGLRKKYIRSDYAVIEMLFIKKYIKPNIDSNSTLNNSLEKIIEGDNALSIKGLKSLVGNQNISLDNKIVINTTKNYISKREIFKEVVKANYKRDFVLTDKVKYLGRDNNTLLIKGNIILYYGKNGEKKYNVPVKFVTTNINPETFNVLKLEILDSKIKNYLNGKIQYKYNNFDELIKTLSKRLENPLVYNDWSKDDIKKSICDKIKSKKDNFKCKNNSIFISQSDLDIKGKIYVKLNLNDKLEVIKVLVRNPVIVELDNILKEKIEIPVKILNKVLNKDLKNNKNYKLVIKNIKEKILQAQKIIIKKRIGLSSDNLDYVASKFRYLGASIKLIRKTPDNKYNIYFNTKGIDFIALYDLKENKIINLSLYKKDRINNKIDIKGLNLKLSKVNSELLNGFKLDPLSFLKEKYPSQIEKYENLK